MNRDHLSMPAARKSASEFVEAHRQAAEPSPKSAPTSREWTLTMWLTHPYRLITAALLFGVAALLIARYGWPF